ncbi:MAG: DUF3108 domain-containing protein [Bacteroidota bacterium]
MKKATNIILIAIVLTAFKSSDNRELRYVQNTSFQAGEVIEFRAHYGFVNAAEARMEISSDIHYVNGRPCYKIDAYANSIGMFDFFMTVRDNWGSYLDTASIIPQKSYRKLREGNYRKHEIVEFDHNKDTVVVQTYHYKKKYWKPKRFYGIPTNAQDIISGYYFLRTMDFSDFEGGEIFNIDAFFEDRVYFFKVKFVRREVLKTKIGKLNSLVFRPIMPDNKLFDGEDSIEIWLSDDENKVPLKIKAKMFIGAVEVDIKSYKKG